jgi:hypothetical protein
MQPGVGYRYISSSQGVTLDIGDPWPDSDGSVCPLQIYGLRYDPTDAKIYINVSPGMINNYGVKDKTGGSLLSTTPPPNIQVFVAALTSTLVTNYVYIVTENSGTPDYDYPDATKPPYISIETALQSDSDTKSYFLIGIVEGKEVSGVKTLNTYNYKGCGSLWSERFKCGTSNVSYWWSAV